MELIQDGHPNLALLVQSAVITVFFGDPAVGTVKGCYVSDCQPIPMCSNENGTCTIPDGQQCTVNFGMGTKWTSKPNIVGSIACTDGVFGDPNYGIVKACYYSNCQPVSNPTPPTPTIFNVNGVVYDATTDQPISADILQSGNLAVTYTDQSGKSFPATVSNGAWLIQLPQGNYRRDVSLQGWSSVSSQIQINADVVFPASKVFMSQNIQGWRVVLSWGAVPKDLDLHLVIPNGGGEVNYTTRSATIGNGLATLDHDTRTGFGPETITINGQVQGNNYIFYVFNYSNEAALSDSGAKVTVYNGNQQVTEVTVPQGSGTFRKWNVVSVNIDSQSVTPINTFE